MLFYGYGDNVLVAGYFLFLLVLLFLFVSA